MFQNGAWNRTLPNLVVFDDVFVDQNIHSGLAVAAGHRQRLHELILGSQAVALNRQLQQLIAQVEVHNASLRERAAVIPITERRRLSVDEFCALPTRDDIDSAIEATERNLAAAREQEPVRNTPLFEPLNLPPFDLRQVDSILNETLETLDAAAAANVQAHLAGLGRGAETWVSEGMRRVSAPSVQGGAASCPFCAQDLHGSPVINHYRAYFSNAYSDLKHRIAGALQSLNLTHGNDRPSTFERSVRVVVERRQFWARFGDVSEVTIDTAGITHDWQEARRGVEAVLIEKQASPLDPRSIPEGTRDAILRYEEHRKQIALLNDTLQKANGTIRLIKEQAATGSITAISADLDRLKAVKARYSPPIAALCDSYLAEKAAKAATELQRDQARQALDNYRTTVFAGYQTAVNLYLQRFNAGFRLDSVTSSNTRGGPTCTYNVIINNTPVQVGSETTAGEPSFRSTLSAGDRNTLALAFFFASLDQDPGLANKVVVIDDPVSSLDDHRSLTTIQEIRRLAERAGQVIVLSHNKGFLARIWEGTVVGIRGALQVTRDGVGSTLRSWNVDQDCVTEYDRRHAMLREYLSNGTPNNREVARAIRPVLEGFLRVACPQHFPSGTLLGHFLNVAEQRVASPQQILDQQSIQELGDLIEYANKFHHDTNTAWETEQINDGELQGFVRRALDFAKR
jgi:wobble nucleotide-excising tRNase